uniref:Homeodomain mating-type protein n=1 Tax=Coprinellus disseminatus TaxID=71703 RepID=Q1WMN3_COPDI|nr:homeodomain mating-type protein [Coprinellus disseminatus]
MARRTYSSLTASNLDNDVRNTLNTLQSEFLAVLRDGPAGLLAFAESYGAFTESLHPIHDRLQPETQTEITMFAEFVDSVAETSVEAEDACTRTIEGLTTAIPQVLNQQDGCSRRRQQPLPELNLRRFSPLPKYLEPALRWLKQNIHNPYPSQAVRNAIAHQTQSALKDIDAWFIDIRKRIGWSCLRYKRFRNRKADIVDAASRFFTNSDPHRPLEGIIESEFASIASTVDQLYTEKCAGSALAYCLDEAVKDLTPDLRVSLSKRKRVGDPGTRETRRPNRRGHPYPTPNLSPTALPTPLASPEPPCLEEAHTAISKKSRKRSRSSSYGYSTDNEEGPVRASKRLSSAPTLCTPPQSCYPSPAASVVLDLIALPADPLVSASPKTGKGTGKGDRTSSDSLLTRASPSRESESQAGSSSNQLPLSADATFCQATFSPSSSVPPVIPEAATYGSFGPLDPFFSVFMHGGVPDCGNSSAFSLFNVVDDAVPTNVQVEFDQSWLSCDVGALATSGDASITGYDLGFDDFGHSIHSGTLDSFNDSLWYGTQQPQSSASTSYSGTGVLTLAGQSKGSPPSLTGVYDVASPSSPSPAKLPSALLTDKARELTELEARCAALRRELAGAS